MKSDIYGLFRRIMIALLTLMTGAACSDDSFRDPDAQTADGNVTICIPMPQLASGRADITTADTDITSAEGTVKSLWLMAYAVSPEAVTHRVNLITSESTLTTTYTQYRQTLHTGDYRIYVVANIPGITAATTEDQLKSLILDNSGSFPDPADGLPMICLPGEIRMSATGTPIGDPGTVTISHNSIYADLTFACAKVRYTLLFDSSDTGFSAEAFAGSSLTVNSISIVNYNGRTPLIKTNAAYTPVMLFMDADDTPQGTHTAWPADYDAFIDDPTDLPATNPATGTRRAYQGTLYLPENMVTATGSRTALSIETTIADRRHTFEMILVPDQTASDRYEPLERGHFYDIIGRVTSLGRRFEVITDVKPWTLATVSYTLHGPYYLHIDQTEAVVVIGGDETVLHFETNAEDLSFTSPKYRLASGEEIDIYSVSFRPDKGELGISINPDMPVKYKEIDGRPANLDFYNNPDYLYVDLKANNLTKRITIDPDLSPYLRVKPSDQTIYLKEHTNDATFAADFSYETNLDRITVSCDNISQNSHITSPQVGASGLPRNGVHSLILDKPGNTSYYPLTLVYNFTYTATDNDGTVTLTANSKVTVIPNPLFYTIHFRGNGWSNPHCYAYELLTVPEDYPDTAMAGKGIKNGTGDNADQDALLYSFTGKISFKGWKGYGGSFDINNIDDKNPANNSGALRHNPLWVEPVNAYASGHTYYYTDIDFVAQTRAAATCSYCKNDGSMNRKWPGVKMEKETGSNTGWYKLILPGVATPGRTLIMFTDGHSWQDNDNGGRRYPASLDPGVPLFDYPDKEGWFDYYGQSGTQFTDDKPYTIVYRIYFPNSSAGWYNRIHIWNGSNIVNDGNSTDESVYGKYGKYNYIDLSLQSGLRYNMIVTNGSDWNSHRYEIGLTTSQFSTANSPDPSIRCYTIDVSGTTYSGAPAGGTTSYTYRIKWPTSLTRDYIYLWNESGDILGSLNKTCHRYTGTDGTYRYYEFTSALRTGTIGFLLKSNGGTSDWSGEIRNTKVPLSSFTSVSGQSYQYQFTVN